MFGNQRAGFGVGGRGRFPARLPVNPYAANPHQASQIRQARRGYGGNTARLGMIEIGQSANGMPPAASPVFGGFGAQPGLYPVKETGPSVIRGAALGFDQTVAASAAVSVTSRPQQAFRAEKLDVATSIAPNFIIRDIKIGNTSMFLNSTAIPAECFTPDAVGVHLNYKTAQQGQDVVVDVTEILAAQTRFLACLSGTMAE